MPDLTLLMPVYNETATIELAIRSVLHTDFGVDGMELIVIDDASTDGTRALLEAGEWDDRVRVLYRAENRGKGAAIRTGLQEVRGSYCAILDADLEHSPADIPRLLSSLVASVADRVNAPTPKGR